MRRRRTQPEPPPSAREYLRVVDRYAAQLRAWVAALIESAKARQGLRADMVADDSDATEIVARSLVLELVLAEWLSRIPRPPTVEKMKPALMRTGTRAARGARRSLVRAGVSHRLIAMAVGMPPTTTGDVVSAPLGPDLDDLLAQWVKEGADLIESVRDELIPDLRAHILDSARSGDRWERITERALARADVSRSRMRLIARDQTAKLNGRITEHMQARAGVTHYIWRASGDGRVRDTHAANDGERFAWSSPPPETGHPGQDYQCRCTAEAVIPE